MIGYYNYTVILTYIGTFFGFWGITCAMAADFRSAFICLLVAGFCDMFDGKIASTRKRTKEEKRFGIQIDSLSDLICFGVLPALIVYRYTGGEFLYVLISAAYALCALIRLAWFNVDEEARQDREESSRDRYLGLPVTTSAILLPFFAGCAQLLKLPLDSLFPWFLLLVAIAFLTPFRMKKPHTLGKILMILFGAGTLALVLVGVSA